MLPLALQAVAPAPHPSSLPPHSSLGPAVTSMSSSVAAGPPAPRKLMMMWGPRPLLETSVQGSPTDAFPIGRRPARCPLPAAWGCDRVKAPSWVPTGPFRGLPPPAQCLDRRGGQTPLSTLWPLHGLCWALGMEGPQRRSLTAARVGHSWQRWLLSGDLSAHVPQPGASLPWGAQLRDISSFCLSVLEPFLLMAFLVTSRSGRKCLPSPQDASQVTPAQGTGERPAEPRAACKLVLACWARPQGCCRGGDLGGAAAAHPGPGSRGLGELASSGLRFIQSPGCSHCPQEAFLWAGKVRQAATCRVAPRWRPIPGEDPEGRWWDQALLDRVGGQRSHGQRSLGLACLCV